MESTVVYKLELVAKKGKFRGMKGALYNLASVEGACRLLGGVNVIGDGDTEDTSTDIFVVLYFYEHKELAKFVNEAKKAFRSPDYLKKCAPDYKPRISHKATQYRVLIANLEALSNQTFESVSPAGSIDFDREIQNLSSYASSSQTSSQPSKKPRSSGGGRSSPPTPGRSSPPSSGGTSARSSGRRPLEPRTTALFKYQTVEGPGDIAVPYRLHLIPKRMNPVEDSNNYFAGSWHFHQLLDGLNLIDGLPALVVTFDRWDETASVEAGDGVRHKVFVRIYFRDEVNYKVMQDQFRARMKDGSKVLEDGSVETFVHVTDVAQFRMSLNMKKSITEGSWGICG